METALKFANLVEFFEESLKLVPSADRTCVEVIRADQHDVLTFGQLRERAQGFALWLAQEAGIGIGDKVAIVSRNRADWDVALWGSLVRAMATL